MKPSLDDLHNYLKEQIQFLIISSNLYDQGITSEAKRLAVTIRVLVHDTGSSVSLLNHLGCKKKMYYYNTAIPETKFGLCGISTTSEGGGKTVYSAPLDSGGSKRKENPWVPFDKWWTDTNVLNDGKNKFTRSDFVRYMANQDGGAHVGKKLNEKYVDLSRNNSMNVFHKYPNGDIVSVNEIELASVRQIAFELLRSLEGKFPNYFEGFNRD